MKAFLILTAFTIATRAWIFGNPVIHVDDQFYLLVGSRFLHGELPYIDIWDRKPIGLFLIYAFANWAFPNPVIGYQLLAALSVALTSYLLFVIARRQTPFAAALSGAAAYPAWLLLFGGIGGQTPVFYNLPMAAAAALTISAIGKHADGSRTRRGCAIMLLTGIAIQIKYSVLFEGIFFGVSLLWAARASGRSWSRLAIDAVLWIACALAPTMAAIGAYLVVGHGSEFIQANFISIFADKVPLRPALARLAWEFLALAPFWACTWIVLRKLQAAPLGRNRDICWIIAWAGAAISGFLLFGFWFDHYVLPLLLPLSLIAALAFGSLRRKWAAISLVVGIGLSSGVARAAVDAQGRGDARTTARLAGLIEHHRGTGCLYVYDEQSIYYYITHSCLPTRFIFPDHLALKRFKAALGTDQAAEIRRVLASEPTVIVIWTNPEDTSDYSTRELVMAKLKRNYRQVGTQQIGTDISAVYALVRPAMPLPRELPHGAAENRQASSRDGGSLGNLRIGTHAERGASSANGPDIDKRGSVILHSERDAQ